ncbi:uncharacterized protein CXQ87_000506 [Candidozyma duobushaemuli]|uniref:nitric oxide dioxygenase n=1 Tax=Candidozyma duobushaemuli TaxID=1231522 RepID=A0A2V1AIR1_9ASCO|nr:uncharacterized protein CXQ87_000506 [[Candida] duobushaemulonis]PVH17615.1 hypothetical protein CXQ87_000506 [[Candida] duobushaemulonis]
MASAPQIYKPQPLTTAQKELIKASVPILETSGLDLTKTFYNSMLSGNPEVRPFFNDTNQITYRQPKVLAFALLNYAKNIDDLTPLTDFVNQIVVKHVGLQVRAEHYPVVGSHLIATMGKLLGEKIATPEFVEAWSIAYGNLAQLLIDAEFAEYQKQPWEGFKDFVVTRIENETDDVKSVYFKPADGTKVAQPLRGQYLGFRFLIPGSDIEKSREYSISEYPDGEYRISVKKLDKGFTYQETDKDVVLFAGGIGITPLISITEKALQDGKKVTLLYSNQRAEAIPFENWFKQKQNENPNFKFVSLNDDKNEKLSQSHFDSLDLPNSEVYMLGPLGYMEFVREELSKRGKTDIHSEFFGPTAV